MKHSKLSIIGALAIAATSLVAPAAQATAWPANFAEFSNCANTASIFCIQDFKVDAVVNSTTNWTAAPDGVQVHAYFVGRGESDGTVTATLPGFTFSIENNGLQELAPALPTGSKVHVKVNLGPWNPRADFSNSTSKVLSWDSEKINGNWIFTVDLLTSTYSFATECWPWSDPWSDSTTHESGDYCTNPRHRHDYDSYAQISVGSDPTNPNFPDTSPSAGVWVAGNATGGSSPSLNVDTKTFEMEYAGPPTKIDGSPNFIFAQAFIPDHTLSELYGIDPASVLANGSFSVTRKDGNTTSSVVAQITHVNANIPGILISIPEIVTYVAAPAPLRVRGLNHIRTVAVDASNKSKTTPKIKIRIKKFKAAKPGVAKITGQRINGKYALLTVHVDQFTTGVETKCTKGKKVKTSSDYMGRYGLATIKLTKGTWKCKVRAIRADSGKKLYSAWSPSVAVKK